MFTTKTEVRNDQDRPHVVYVEPWANDYTLLPKERLQVVVFGSTTMPWFAIVEAGDATQVYCEDTDGFEVYQGDKPLECGHQRGARPQAAP